jgi:hypothetical protein
MLPFEPSGPSAPSGPSGPSNGDEDLCCNLPEGKTCEECRKNPEDCPRFGKKTKAFVLAGKGDSNSKEIFKDTPSGDLVDELNKNECVEVIELTPNRNQDQKGVKSEVLQQIANNIDGDEAAIKLFGHSEGGTIACIIGDGLEAFSEIWDLEISVETFGAGLHFNRTSGLGGALYLWGAGPQIAHLFGAGLDSYTVDMVNGNLEYPKLEGTVHYQHHIHQKDDVVSYREQGTCGSPWTTVSTYLHHNHASIVTEGYDSIKGPCTCPEEIEACRRELERMQINHVTY